MDSFVPWSGGVIRQSAPMLLHPVSMGLEEGLMIT
jgi:hypothetical protein